jgi:Fic family protein
VTCDLIRAVHALIIGDADSDHCQPGVTRKGGDNVTFGLPPHRGCEGGKECDEAFDRLGQATQQEFKDHDLLIQALALHFHFAAMHPFLDGNGRTARAVEALMLQRSGLTDHLFIAMSNYYYDEKTKYLATLSEVRAPDYDLTPFLKFGLKGIKIQCARLFQEIRVNVSKSIFTNTMYGLFGRLQTRRKRLIGDRHIEILKLLMSKDKISIDDALVAVEYLYRPLKAGSKARVRDFIHLLDLDAIRIADRKSGGYLYVNLEWPTQITENGFMEKAKKMPKAKDYPFFN